MIFVVVVIYTFNLNGGLMQIKKAKHAGQSHHDSKKGVAFSVSLCVSSTRRSCN